MHRIDNSTSVATMPIRKPVGTWGYFSQGSESSGQLATIVEADIMNAIMMEIANVVTKAGFALNKLDDTQLWQAINALIAAARLGFVPVEQGGGAGQGTNKIHLGWGTDGSGLRAQVDVTDVGPIALLQRQQNWSAQQNFQVVTATNVTSSGDVNASGNANINGVVTGGYGRLTYGAKGSGDPSRMVTLGDFGFTSFATQEFVRTTADGFILQGSNGAIPAIATGTPYAQTFLLPMRFPNAHLWSLATWGGTTPPNTGTIAAQPWDQSSIEISINAPSGPQYGFAYIAAGY
jgi:hypothetical protein